MFGRVRNRPRSLLRDRRGLGVAEYALMLFLVVLIGAVAFRFIGKSVTKAGTRTGEQFQAGNSNDKNASGANSAGAGGANSAGGANDQANAGGGAGGAGGAGSANAGRGSPNAKEGPANASAEEEDNGERQIPIWKIMAGVFVVLFAVGGYFAFRKQRKGG